MAPHFWLNKGGALLLADRTGSLFVSMGSCGTHYRFGVLIFSCRTDSFCFRGSSWVKALTSVEYLWLVKESSRKEGKNKRKSGGFTCQLIIYILLPLSNDSFEIKKYFIIFKSILIKKIFLICKIINWIIHCKTGVLFNINRDVIVKWKFFVLYLLDTNLLESNIHKNNI